MPPKAAHAFDAEVFLHSAGIARRVEDYAAAVRIFAQGDVADTVLYIQHGRVKLSGCRRTARRQSSRSSGPVIFSVRGPSPANRCAWRRPPR